MPRRDGYAHGTPGWVDLSTEDVPGSKGFYGELFGWSWDDQPGPSGELMYAIAHLDGATVAGLGPAPPEMIDAGVRAAWNTYLMVDSADEAHQAVLAAGGKSLAGPFDVMRAGRMAFVMDDQGACSGLWQAGLHRGAEVVREPGALTWVEFYGADTGAAARFYAAALGLVAETEKVGAGPYAAGEALPIGAAMAPEDPDGGKSYTAWKVGEEAVAGLMKMPMEGMPPQWHVYFGVGDIEEAAERIRGLGGTVHGGPFPTPAGSVVAATDHVGALFSVIQLDEWPTG